MLMKFFKDTYDELNGVDIEARNRQERENRKIAEQAYRKDNFVPKWVKKYSIVLTVFYLLLALLEIYGSIKTSNIAVMCREIFFSLLAVVGTVLIIIKNKNYQKIGSVVYSVFLVIQVIRFFVK